nr:hypothetical protein [Tanacetum cinerariifolium]
YVLDLIELDEHVPVYVPEPKHSEYHALSDDDIQFEDDDEDPEEDPSEEHEPEDDDEDPEEDPNEEHKPENADTKEPSKGSDETEPFEEDKIADPSKEHEPEDDDEDPNEEHASEDEDTKEEEPFEGSDETELFKENETTVTPPPPRHRRARISVRPQTPMAVATQALIDAFVVGSPSFPLPPTSPAYDQAPLAYSFVVAVARAPRGQYDFVDTVVAGQSLVCSSGHDAWTIARAADRA